MKLAICFYGFPRFYNNTILANQELYQGCTIDYYAHFWEADLKEQEKIKKTYNFKKVEFDDNSKFVDPIDYPVDMSRASTARRNIISPIFSIKQLNLIAKNVKDDYDFFILTRTDVCGLGNSLCNFNLDKNNIYTSYVPGEEWLNTVIDMKFIMCNKDNFIQLTSVYDNIKKFTQEDKVPFLDHTLFFHMMKDKKNNMFQLALNPNKGIQKGWFFIREVGLSNQ